jgi:L-arabinose isomerase
MEKKIESFEVTKGGKSGDLLSEMRQDKKLKIGFAGYGYFEYWRMYKNLRNEVVNDMQIVADKLSRKHDIFYPGLIETLDAADEAGKLFKEKHIELLIIAEGTYVPDFFVHQTLNNLSGDIPLICFATSLHGKIDFNSGYDVSLRNTGLMGLVQLTGGFKKMATHEKYEVIIGGLDDDEVYESFDQIIQVITTIKNLKNMTIGVVGHVFRGMYDFEYEKTSVTGKLGPHIMDVNIDHLMNVYEENGASDLRIKKLSEKTKSDYKVVDLKDEEIMRSSRLAVAFQDLIKRYKLNGLVLLGQHLIEAKANATCHLGLSEILRTDQAVVVTEGDVLGCIMCKIGKDFTGHNPFFGEWEEIDTSMNAMMLLGHGFIDSRECRTDRPVYVKPACENWGFEGNSVGFEATYKVGPITMTHVIQDSKGWRLLISEGEQLDVPPLKINECALVVRVEKPIKQYFNELMHHGFSHHSIAIPGKIGKQLECLARQLSIEVNWI